MVFPRSNLSSTPPPNLPFTATSNLASSSSNLPPSVPLSSPSFAANNMASSALGPSFSVPLDLASSTGRMNSISNFEARTKSIDPDTMQNVKDETPFLKLPLELVWQIGSLLDYPNFSMLRCTNRYFRYVWSEEDVKMKFLALTLDQQTDEYLDRIGACRKGFCLGGWGCTIYLKESPGDGAESVDVSNGHHRFRIIRPGAIVRDLIPWQNLGRFLVYACEVCGTFEVVNKEDGWPSKTICKGCWDQYQRRCSRTRGTPRELRMEFCKRYGDWLRLIWRWQQVHWDGEEGKMPDV